MRRWYSVGLRTGGIVGSDGWNYRRSGGVIDAIPISRTFLMILTEPLQFLLRSEKHTADPWAEGRVRFAKRGLEAVVRRTTVFETHDFNESGAGV